MPTLTKYAGFVGFVDPLSGDASNWSLVGASDLTDALSSAGGPARYALADVDAAPNVRTFRLQAQGYNFNFPAGTTINSLTFQIFARKDNNTDAVQLSGLSPEFGQLRLYNGDEGHTYSTAGTGTTQGIRSTATTALGTSFAAIVRNTWFSTGFNDYLGAGSGGLGRLRLNGTFFTAEFGFVWTTDLAFSQFVQAYGMSLTADYTGPASSSSRRRRLTRRAFARGFRQKKR